MGLRRLAALLALAAIAVALFMLLRATAPLQITEARLGPTPVTVYRQSDGGPAPAVLIAHGFAGSQQLMEPFAVSLARAGYLAVTYDLLGHGRNAAPLAGDVTAPSGATRNLLAELARVAEFALELPGADGRLALLGHSMASDIVVRYAAAHPKQVEATIAVSLFSREVTAAVPRNLLVIVGAWEAGLRAEGLRVLRLAGGADAEAGRTVGRFADGSARRLVFADGVEHIGVLYSGESLRAAVAWLNGAFGRDQTGRAGLRGPWLALLFGGLVLLAWPLASLLPRAAAGAPAGAGGPGLGWRRLWPLLLAPAVATPLVLRLLPTDFLPMLVGDYLAAHFALYGLLTAGLIWRFGPAGRGARPCAAGALKTAAAAGLIALYGLGALGVALDSFVLSFTPTALRAPLIAVMLAGTLAYFLADEWLTRRAAGARGAYPASKLCFLLSLALAVALDFERLFFLVIILPLILVFFLVYGLFSRWAFRATGQPLAAGLANALAFAWAIAVTFPILSG